jgi:hypothetical protein
MINHMDKAICVRDEHLMTQHAPNTIVTTAHSPQDDPCRRVGCMGWCEGLLAGIGGTTNDTSRNEKPSY